ncbi:MAG: hypothetical protein JWM03_1666 [Rhodocyclales bacterium]|nr:hypothetical protein [Rhodocyclales bacterium]
MPVIGVRNTKIGRKDFSWDYGNIGDWALGFHAGQLWLAYQLTGEARFSNNARARRPAFDALLRNPARHDHDLGFQFSLSCVADWLMTGDEKARSMALSAATALSARFQIAGAYLQAWNAEPRDPARTALVAGRVIADSMENIALLHWACVETGNAFLGEIAQKHAETVRQRIVRADGSSFHTFVFDPASGEPLRGETYQGFAHDSCWSRGQAWLIHGFALAYRRSGDPRDLETAIKLAVKAESLLGDQEVPPWDYCLPDGEVRHLDSSAGAITAAGVLLLASLIPTQEPSRWRAFGNRLIDGLLEKCDLTRNPDALGMLDFGAANVNKGFSRNMLPYGDYFFMEALMRALGHTQFFW